MNKTNIIFVIFLVLVLVGSYYIFKNFSVVDVSLGEEFIEKEAARKDFLILTDKLKKTALNIDFFDNDKFKELKDLSVTIELPEETGRLNPFLPF